MLGWVLLAGICHCIAGASMSQYDRPLTRLSTESSTAENEALALTLVKSASLGPDKGQRLFAEVTSVSKPCPPVAVPVTAPAFQHFHPAAEAEAGLAEVLQDTHHGAYFLVIPGREVPARQTPLHLCVLLRTESLTGLALPSKLLITCYILQASAWAALPQRG